MAGEVAMRTSVIFVRFGLRTMEDDALAFLVRSTWSKQWGLRVVDNIGNPETLVKLWDRVAREEAAGGAEVVCFLNSDCWVGEGWDDECVKVLADPRVAVCGPQCNMGPQTAAPEVPVPLVVPQGWPDWVGVNRAAAFCRRTWSGQFRESEVYGHCYAVRVDALRKADWLAPEIAGQYTFYGAEQSLSRRLREAGYVTGTAMGAFCFHAGEVSGRAAQARGEFDLEAERAKGRRLFFGNEVSP